MTATAGRTDTRASDAEARRHELVASLSLERKVEVLTGRTAWRLPSLPEIGLGPVTMSDGPVGVRGTGEVDGATSVLMPSPTALAATWSPALAERVGGLFALEARRHDVDVVLAPQVNLQRTPVGGRHFECYSEDPLLTTELGVALVRGIQAHGVAACMKHYVANDSETRRTEYVSIVDEAVLREAYLAPFEAAVEAGVWSIMAAYNLVDDGTESSPMTEHQHLVVDVLKREWGFDGVVVSDWTATSSTVESALGGLDLVMPGPADHWGARLVEAVRDGRVPESVVDEKVERLLLLAERVGRLGAPATSPAGIGDERALVREVGTASTVVVRRPSTGLPDLTTARSIALVGPNAARPHVMGGGSSTVTPHHVVTPLEGLRRALPDAAVTLHRGGESRVLADAVAPGEGVGELRATVTLEGPAGTRVVDEPWHGWAREVPEGYDRVVLRGELLLEQPGLHEIEVGTVGVHRVEIDGAVVSSSDEPAGAEVMIDSSVNNPPGTPVPVSVTSARAVPIVATLEVVEGEGWGRFARGQVRHRAADEDPARELEDAVHAARVADATVVIVGTNEESESEGWDRTTLALPGTQDALVERVLDVAPDAIVVVNAGAPVLLPWLDRARTVLWTWFPGQEAGDALADVLTGRAEPAGRLPWTLPARAEDVPVPDAVPAPGGALPYEDGVHVGYRGWQRSGVAPAAAFGSGMGWTDVEHRAASATLADDGGIDVRVELANLGDREGTEVVQVYLEPPEPVVEGIDRPVRWLAGFARASVPSRGIAEATVHVAPRALEVWRGAWWTPAGTYRVLVGPSVAGPHHRIDLEHPGQRSTPDRGDGAATDS